MAAWDGGVVNATQAVIPAAVNLFLKTLWAQSWTMKRFCDCVVTAALGANTGPRPEVAVNDRDRGGTAQDGQLKDT